MTKSAGPRIIKALKQAAAGDFSVVTIEGQTWVRRDDLSKAVEALKPFAEAASNLDEDKLDRHHLWESAEAMILTAGDLRRAREAYAHLTVNKKAEE